MDITLNVSEENEIILEAETEQVSLTTDEVVNLTCDDYLALKNKPFLNGKEIVGEMQEEDPTVPLWAKEEKKPDYTPEEISAVNTDSSITLEEIDQIFSSL